jgi:hypothetical protein
MFRMICKECHGRPLSVFLTEAGGAMKVVCNVCNGEGCVISESLMDLVDRVEALCKEGYDRTSVYASSLDRMRYAAQTLGLDLAAAELFVEYVKTVEDSL